MRRATFPIVRSWFTPSSQASAETEFTTCLPIVWIIFDCVTDSRLLAIGPAGLWRDERNRFLHGVPNETSRWTLLFLDNVRDQAGGPRNDSEASHGFGSDTHFAQQRGYGTRRIDGDGAPEYFIDSGGKLLERG